MAVKDETENVVTQLVDYKGPLKGKGRTLAQWESDVRARLAQIYEDMNTLSAESRNIDGRTFGLYVMNLREALQLRWRTTSSQHVTWARLEPTVDKLPQGLAQWYRQAEEVAQVLNHHEQALQYELKTVQRLAQRGPGPLRRFPGEVGKGFGGGRPPGQSAKSAAKSRQ